MPTKIVNEGYFIITCTKCGKKADVREDPHAWDGWVFVPKKTLCPKCSTNENGEIDLEKIVERLR